MWWAGSWWGEEFLKFLAALEHFAATIPEADPVFWICSFAVRSVCKCVLTCSFQNNQHSVDLGADLADSPFEHALASPSCKGVVMVLDSEATTLTRVWCLCCS